MLANKRIEDLIKCPKYIFNANPKQGMATDNKSALIKRKNLNLKSEDETQQFTVFMRQNTMLIEQFSIGLLYQPESSKFRKITLVRFNGEHGQTDWSKDHHYNSFHIHYLNEALLKQGIFEPKSIEITDKFNTFHSALFEFFNHVNIVNYIEFFPNFKKVII
jgi:hypothetical protein